MKTIQCVLFIRQGSVDKRIVDVQKEFPVEMTEAEAAQWIFQDAKEHLPTVKNKHVTGHD